MNIRTIHVSNFKSFSDETISFDRLNVLIGANASGKSNVIALFRFFTNIINYGIDNAISMLGGMEYLLNANIGKSKPMRMSIDISFADEKWQRLLDRKKRTVVRLDELQYEFELTPHKKGTGYKITHDTLKMVFVPISKKSDDVSNSENYIVIYHKDKVGKASSSLSGQNTQNLTDEQRSRLCYDVFLPYINEKENRKELLIHDAGLFLPPFFQEDSFLKIFDFDPNLMKQATHLRSLNRLEENGSNLATILQRILVNSSSRKKLISLMKYCLPFFENIEIENNFDQSITYKIKETYSPKKFYSNFLSDGTVNMLALVIALYFTKESKIVILEEPERNLHPQLMKKLIELAKDASSEKQIIITTHTPEIIKYTELTTLLLAHRSKEGFTHVEKPVANERIQSFLKNDIGIDELFAQNLLGV